MSSWTPVPLAAGWGSDPGPGRDGDVRWGPHSVGVHGGLLLLQPFTCHWEPSGRSGTLSYCLASAGHKAPSHSSRFQGSHSVPGARARVELHYGPSTRRPWPPCSYPDTASEATAQVAGQAARAKRPSCLPVTIAKAKGHPASASTSPSEAPPPRASDTPRTAGTGPG